ncbi:MAG: TonB box-like protein [Candidatus Buchananbacteria bacterium RIFCSPLOWO2_01_FULL_46_12]|uniref:TonB box-like protein n=1 Tax=Candidatus Buchananbacteria bacterium RIFCSPLOWO2_01_FULL_46_12 TaxID=1797546 RepID=A0A1G1YQ60_9BACT|nr:MAG: TonB box-like protein [Candidatus Buchananbacteria bacterium RIFCSPLOWO2_01_FULL_46_12]
MQLGIYKHYKGKLYRVLGVAKHSETLEELVVYEALYDNLESKLWVRPKKMFEENVELDGKTVPRFKYIGNDLENLSSI